MRIFVSLITKNDWGAVARKNCKQDSDTVEFQAGAIAISDLEHTESIGLVLQPNSVVCMPSLFSFHLLE